MTPKLKPVKKNIDQSILVKHDRMNRFYAPHHYHPEYEIIYIKKSYGIRFVGNHIDNYKAGEVIVLGPGLPHYHAAGGDESDSDCIETIAVLFPSEIFEANLQFPEFALATKLLAKIRFGIELHGETKFRVQSFLENLTLNPSFSNHLVLFQILETLLHVNSEYSQLSTVEFNNKKAYNDKTKYVLDYIADNYMRNISIDEVASLINLSKSGFCNFFKTHTGVTFSHYLNMIRISKACELLLTTRKSISEIAFETAYENLAYFNRRFKETKGMTPKEFRKNMDENQTRKSDE